MKVQIGNQTIDVPQGVEVKIIDNEPKYKFKVTDYVSYEGGVYRIVGLTDRGYEVKEICPPAIFNEWEPVELGFSQHDKMKLLPDYQEIIEGWGDAHKPELRFQINDAWNKYRKGFKEILCALYARDIDEITEHDAFRYSDWVNAPEFEEGCITGNWKPYMDLALRKMQTEWDLYADNYLNHIADDGDLECILNFLHYPYLPCYKD